MIKNLTALRGIFILFIFFHHCMDLYPGGGTMAVTFFFVLGGFSMVLGYRDRIMSSGFKYKEYLIRRCIKFYPLHWICLLAALLLVIPSLKIESIPSVFLNAALLQTCVPIKSIYFSFNAVSWYLADTMLFAIAFPFVFKWILKASRKGIVGAAVLFSLIYITLLFLLPEEKWHAIFYISPYMRLYDFMFGIFLGLIFLKLKDTPWNFMKNNKVNVIMIFAIIIMLVVESCILSQDMRLIAPLYWPLVAILVLIASLSSVNVVGGGNLLENKALQYLGELSFVIFLIHQLVLRYSSIAINKYIHFDNTIIFVAATLVITILVSVLVERYILKPVSKWLTKKILPSTIAQ